MYRITIAILSTLVALTACTGPGSVEIASPLLDETDIPSLSELQQMESVVETREEIHRLIHFYQGIQGGPDVLKSAHTRASSLLLLVGAEYSRSRSEQRHYYKKAAALAERALLHDDSFKAARIAGKAIPDAAEAIGEGSFEPLFIWATAVFYHFRDVASVPERILFNSRLKEAARAIEVIIEKDPSWYGGSLQFSLGIFYLSVPKVIGGDREAALRMMEEAIAMSDKRLLPRWGRAKYLAIALHDKDMFLRDLNWVIGQDLSKMEGPAIWNRYFQEDARRLLKQTEVLF